MHIFKLKSFFYGILHTDTQKLLDGYSYYTNTLKRHWSLTIHPFLLLRGPESQCIQLPGHSGIRLNLGSRILSSLGFCSEVNTAATLKTSLLGSGTLPSAPSV